MIKKSQILPFGNIFEFITNSQILGDGTNSDILKKLDKLIKDKSSTKMNNNTHEILFDSELAGSLSDDTKKKIIFSILNDYYGEKPIVKKSSIIKKANRGKLAARVLGWVGKKLFARNAAKAAGKATAQAAGNATAQAAANGVAQASTSGALQVASNGAAQAAVKPSIWGTAKRYGRYGLNTIDTLMAGNDFINGVDAINDGRYMDAAYDFAVIPFWFNHGANSLSKWAKKPTNPLLVRGAGKLIGGVMTPYNKVLAYGNSPGRSGILGFNRNNSLLKYISRHPIITSDIAMGLAGSDESFSRYYKNGLIDYYNWPRYYDPYWEDSDLYSEQPDSLLNGSNYNNNQNSQGNSYFNF